MKSLPAPSSFRNRTDAGGGGAYIVAGRLPPPLGVFAVKTVAYLVLALTIALTSCAAMVSGPAATLAAFSG